MSREGDLCRLASPADRLAWAGRASVARGCGGSTRASSATNNAGPRGFGEFADEWRATYETGLKHPAARAKLIGRNLRDVIVLFSRQPLRLFRRQDRQSGSILRLQAARLHEEASMLICPRPTEECWVQPGEFVPAGLTSSPELPSKYFFALRCFCSATGLYGPKLV